MNLPEFTYHPHPLLTGSVQPSAIVCEVCNQARGFVYAAGVYGLTEASSVCPWCIADGSAHARLKVEFSPREAIGGEGWDEVPSAVKDEIAFRTPGFSGWQNERWFSHCGDAAVFLGPMGREELEKLGDDAARYIQSESRLVGEQWAVYYAAMHRNDGPVTAYLFRCRRCGTLGGYSDFR